MIHDPCPPVPGPWFVWHIPLLLLQEIIIDYFMTDHELRDMVIDFLMGLDPEPSDTGQVLFTGEGRSLLSYFIIVESCPGNGR